MVLFTEKGRLRDKISILRNIYKQIKRSRTKYEEARFLIEADLTKLLREYNNLNK